MASNLAFCSLQALPIRDSVLSADAKYSWSWKRRTAARHRVTQLGTGREKHFGARAVHRVANEQHQVGQARSRGSDPQPMFSSCWGFWMSCPCSWGKWVFYWSPGATGHHGVVKSCQVAWVCHFQFLGHSTWKVPSSNVKTSESTESHSQDGAGSEPQLRS